MVAQAQGGDGGGESTGTGKAMIVEKSEPPKFKDVKVRVTLRAKVALDILKLVHEKTFSEVMEVAVTEYVERHHPELLQRAPSKVEVPRRAPAGPVHQALPKKLGDGRYACKNCQEEFDATPRGMGRPRAYCEKCETPDQRRKRSQSNAPMPSFSTEARSSTPT